MHRLLRQMRLPHRAGGEIARCTMFDESWDTGGSIVTVVKYAGRARTLPGLSSCCALCRKQSLGSSVMISAILRGLGTQTPQAEIRRRLAAGVTQQSRRFMCTIPAGQRQTLLTKERIYVQGCGAATGPTGRLTIHLRPLAEQLWGSRRPASSGWPPCTVMPVALTPAPLMHSSPSSCGARAYGDSGSEVNNYSRPIDHSPRRCDRRHQVLVTAACSRYLDRASCGDYKPKGRQSPVWSGDISCE